MDDITPQPSQAVLPGLDLIATDPVPARMVPSRFRMDERTRRIGRAGVAAARVQLAAQAARRAEQEAKRSGQQAHRQQAHRPLAHGLRSVTQAA